MLMKDKICLITGATDGIGKETARCLGKQNAQLILVGRNPKKGEKVRKKLIEKTGNNQIEILTADLSNMKAIRYLAERIYSRCDRLDVLINNAGISKANKQSGEIYAKDKWDETLRINLTAHFSCSQEVIQYMKRQKRGSIINITSINAELGFPRNPAYVASKGGLKMLGKALAKDWGKYGIRVNNLGPGYIKTDITKKSYSNKKLREERAKHTMLGRWGDKDDLVGPCIFLASDASKYMTGQDVYVDGGWLSNSIITE